MTKSRSFILAVGLVLASLLLAAACGDDDDADPTGGPSLGVGPGISVTVALDSDLDGPLLVNGFLLVDEHGVRLCWGFLQSLPPHCLGAHLRVEGVDLAQFTLVEARGVRWTDVPVQVLGTVEDDLLSVSATSI